MSCGACRSGSRRPRALRRNSETPPIAATRKACDWSRRASRRRRAPRSRVRHLRTVLPVDEAALSRRRAQNLAAPRADSRGLVPSIRSFAQELDRQRQALEPVPLLSLARPECESIARALDEAEVAAL